MYLLFSGEGKGDMGRCSNHQPMCTVPDYQPGPMAHMVDKLVEQFLGYDYSHIDCERVTFVSEQHLKNNKQPTRKKAMAFKGKKRPAETQYFFENARVLASIAKTLSAELGDKVVAVLFRDADGTASAGRGQWEDKVNSMVNGFTAEEYQHLGVPMMPKPKSEAWLLCAVTNTPYQNCEQLEQVSGNDNAPNPLKDQLLAALAGDSSVQRHNDLLNDGTIDVTRIDMPSFNSFKEKLQAAVAYCQENAQ